MTQLPWIDFLRIHPGAHLVAGLVVQTTSSHHLTQLRKLLDRLIVSLAPTADFSTAVVRQTGETEIHCGFAAKEDADRLARSVKARTVTREGNWASQRFFRLTASTELALSNVLQRAAS